MNATKLLKSDYQINQNHRKENNFDGAYHIFTQNPDGTLAEKISCRFYSTQATSFCCIWISGNGEMQSGSGKAGGYGYHRKSAAAEVAIFNAGFALDANISGVGNEAIKEALLAISATLEYVNPQFFESHA